MALDFLSSIPVIGGYFDHSDDQAMDLLRQNQALYGNIELPKYRDYTPEELKYLGDYRPEDAQSTQISEDPMVRSAQLSALSKMSGLAEQGLGAEDQAAFTRAQNMAAQQAHAGTQAALQNAQARGVGGSGMEFAMREMANQGAAQAAQNAGLDQAANSARQRALYNQAYMQGMGNVRGQDLQANSANADILNRFNMANTQNRNQAQQYNLGNRQNLSNLNIGERNSAQQYNNDLKSKSFQNAMAKAGGMSGANRGVADAYYGQNAANTAQRNQLTQIGMMAATGGFSGAGGGQTPQPRMSQYDDYDQYSPSNYQSKGYSLRG